MRNEDRKTEVKLNERDARIEESKVYIEKVED